MLRSPFQLLKKENDIQSLNVDHDVTFVQNQTPHQPNTNEGMGNNSNIIPIMESPSLPPYHIPPIPADILPHVTFLSRPSVSSIAAMTYPDRVCDCELCAPIFSADEPDVSTTESIFGALHQYAWPTLELQNLTHHRWVSLQCPKFRSVQLRHGPAPGAKFPPWCLHLWQLLVKEWDNIQRWRRVLAILQSEMDDETITLLGHVPWPFFLPVRGIVPATITSFATTDWLSDSHMDLLAWMLNDELVDTPIRVLDYPFIIQLQKRYAEKFTGHPSTQTKSSAFESILQQLLNGMLTSVAMCFNVDADNGIPLMGHNGNHWIAVIINIPTLTIWYGDSLERLPHQNVIERITWWLESAFPKAFFRTRILQHHSQPGEWMCGDYAMNMIAHNVKPSTNPLVGPTFADAIAFRRQTFRRVLEICRAS